MGFALEEVSWVRSRGRQEKSADQDVGLAPRTRGGGGGVGCLRGSAALRQVQPCQWRVPGAKCLSGGPHLAVMGMAAVWSGPWEAWPWGQRGHSWDTSQLCSLKQER